MVWLKPIKSFYFNPLDKTLIDLPKSFNHTSVEIIILPIEKTNKPKMIKKMSAEKNERLKKLLSINVWNEADILPILETQNNTNQWKIVAF